MAIDGSLGPVVAAATSDLAARLGVPAEDVSVVSAELVTWPDAGLGCRRPGMRYRQVPVDGSRVVLSYGGRRFDYHSGGRARAPFLCEHPG